MLSSSSLRSLPSMTQWPPGSPLVAVPASLHRHRAAMICGMHEPAALPLAVRAMPTSLGPSSSHRIDSLGHSFLIKRHPQIIAWLFFLRVHPPPTSIPCVLSLFLFLSPLRDKAPTNKIYCRASSEQRPRMRSLHESQRLV